MCGEGEIEDCFQPYPICETEDAPFTILGVSKKVFSDFFGDADSQNVVFGLQRFPQTPTVEAPTCSGGYYAGATEITGDNNALSIPLEMDNWFDASLSEVIVQGFPGSSETSNVDQLQRWLDFTEWTVDTETPCTTTLDCSEGICSGIPGNKFCKTFVNPELRADGWTPLGKSLFYAGEYMRKYVVLDGKACAGDADCPSPGYYCGEGGKCFDPLRECRLNVIVLFTDGGETEYPFATDFFNPVVQAKRLRFGLGCETDEDCSDVDYCKKDEDNPEEYGCYIPRCQPSASEPGVKYCSHDLIESDSSNPVEMQMPGFNRVLDYNGNPIDIITTVVDASVASTEETTATLNNNRRIALYGGGLHVVVNTGDVPDFLAQLKKTIDFKELFTDCAIAGVQ